MTVDPCPAEFAPPDANLFLIFFVCPCQVLQKDSKDKANEHELAPACIARDEERDTELDAAAQGIVSHALWDAGMDCYSDLVVSNARSASLL